MNPYDKKREVSNREARESDIKSKSQWTSDDNTSFHPHDTARSYITTPGSTDIKQQQNNRNNSMTPSVKRRLVIETPNPNLSVIGESAETVVNSPEATNET